MNFSKEFNKVSRLLEEKNNMLLAVHTRPDGDALGAMLAMFLVLSNSNTRKIVMFSKDPVPEYLTFLAGAERIVHNDRGWFGDGPPDIFFGFDYGDFARLGVKEEIIQGAIIITFDHHPRAKQKGDILIIDENASSTCEIVYDFFIAANLRISSAVATALFTGIFTDSGGFSHVTTSVKTLRVAGDLLRYGASIPKVYSHIMSNKSRRSIKAWGHALCVVERDKALGMAYIAITLSEFKNLGGSLEDFEGVANAIVLPPDIKFSLLLIEYEPGGIKGSLRGEAFKGVDVSCIARAFGGGGHKYAAGFETTGKSLENVVELVKQKALEVV